MSLKTENSRRVAKSRLVCMGLYIRVYLVIGNILIYNLQSFVDHFMFLGQVKKTYVSRPDFCQKAGKRGIYFFLAKVISFHTV